MKRLISLVLAFVIFFGIGGTIAYNINNINRQNEATSFTEQLNAVVKKYESRQETQNRLIVNSNKIKETYGAVAVIKSQNFQIMQFDSYSKAENAKLNIEKLGIDCDRDDYAYVESNGNDTSKDLWAAKNVQCDVTNYYLNSTGEKYRDITVAVMDTGINPKHEAFAGRIIECNQNFSSSSNANSFKDDSGHGTNVSGVIALNTLDNIKIKPYKTFDKDGKSTNSQIIATLNYILSEKSLPDVINMSFSVQSLSGSSTRDSLTRTLISKGVTIVTSAGNKNVNAKYYYPANIDGVITVSASNKNNKKADFSNYGKCVDISAPGVGVYTCELDGTYSYQNGTSFSAPFVSGAAATLLMQNGKMTAAQVEDKICKEAVPVYNKITQFEWCGAGIVNYSGLICNERAAEPSFSISQGTYNEPINLEIKAKNGEKIMYTLDDTVPTSKSGELYTKPIKIDKDTHIIAVAYDDKKKSRYAAATYEIVYDCKDRDFEINPDGIITGYMGSKSAITVPDYVNNIKVKAIGDNVFNNVSLTSVNLPDSVEKIGVSAFANCSLSSISANGVKTVENGAFENCASLVSVNMKNVINIGNRCFKNCKLLTTIPFSNNVEKLGANAFAFTGISNAKFPNVTEADGAFENTNIIEAYLPNVKGVYRTFYNCKLLSHVNTSNLEKIDASAFYNCNMLTNFDLTNVREVSANAFRKSGIASADLPNCTKLDTKAFYNCESLNYVNIPNVTRIMPDTFSYCENLEKINMQSVEEFNDVTSSYFTDCVSLKGLFLPNCKNLPNISWSVNMQGAMNLGKKAQLTYIFAPRAEEVYSSKSEPFMYKCAKLKTVILTKVKSIDYINNNTGGVWYFGSDLNNLPSSYENKNITFAAPNLSYAANWAEKMNVDFIETGQISFNKISNDTVYYSTHDKELTLNLCFVKSLWDLEEINKNKKESTISALLDLNNDNILNAKDFAIINKK